METYEEMQPPFGVRVEQSADDTRIVCYWFSMWAVGTLAAAGFFVYALIWLIDNLPQAAGGQLDQGVYALLVAVICGLVYYGIASVVNNTTITITDDEVRVGNGPLPWLGNKRCQRRRIVDVTFRETSEHCERLGRVNRYYVDLILLGGEHMRLLSGFYSGAAAVFVHETMQELCSAEESEISIGAY